VTPSDQGTRCLGVYVHDTESPAIVSGAGSALQEAVTGSAAPLAVGAPAQAIMPHSAAAPRRRREIEVMAREVEGGTA
jgi:hypothetical protein